MEREKRRLFTDDITVLVCNKDARALKSEAEQIISDMKKWFSADKVTLSIDNKSYYCVFPLKNNKIPEFLDHLNIWK